MELSIRAYVLGLVNNALANMQFTEGDIELLQQFKAVLEDDNNVDSQFWVNSINRIFKVNISRIIDLWNSDYGVNECPVCHEKTVIPYGRTRLCSDCFDNGWRVCDDCGTPVRQSQITFYRGDAFCPNCVENHHIIHDLLHSWNYKPEEFIMKKITNECNKPYFGVELEIENFYKRDILKTINNCGFLYLKYDGSLDYGAEIVSHPATLSYHLNNNKNYWERTLKAIKGGKGTSHKSGNCGLHIHINREFLPEDRWLQLEIFMEFYEEIFLKLSRRREFGHFLRPKATNKDYDMDTEDIVEDIVEQIEDAYDEGHDGRYHMVNTINEHTVEIRIFRGTLKYSSFVASLLIVDSLVNYFKEDIPEIERSFKNFEKYSVKLHPELTTYYTYRRIQ